MENCHGIVIEEKYFPEKQLKVKVHYLYALRLDNGKYYIGMTTNVKNRIEQHIEGKGAGFTKRHHPTHLVTCFPLGRSTPFEAKHAEKVLTIEYMLKFGPENVRGGKWLQENNSKYSMQELHAMLEKYKKKAIKWREIADYGGFVPTFIIKNQLP